MRRSKALNPQITLLLLILPGVAHAQVFTVPANPFSPAAASASARQERVQAGLYLALWEFSSIQVGGLSEELKADPSPLITLDYFVTPKFSVGGWWNPFGGEVRAGSRGGPKRKIGD